MTANPQQRIFATFTGRGQAVLASGCTATVCGYLLGSLDLVRIGVLLIALCGANYLHLSFRRYRLTLLRLTSPARMEAGRIAHVTVALHNNTPRRHSLSLAREKMPLLLGADPQFVIPELTSGAQHHVTYTVRCETRGRYQLGPLELITTDPFGLSEHRRAFDGHGELVVLPRVIELQPIILGGDWASSGDNHPRGAGLAGEHDGTIRTYRQGDDLRRVHWRSSARRGELMVRLDEQPRKSKATVFLDRRRSAYRSGTDAFEWAVCAAASVAVHLLEQGYVVTYDDGSRARGHLEEQEDIDAGVLGDSAKHAILDRLAMCGISDHQTIATASRDHQSPGFVIAILGSLTEQDASYLSQRATRGIALIADSGKASSSAKSPGDAMEATTFLRSWGWLVATAGPGEPINHLWQRVASPQNSSVSGSTP
ncbi:MAG: DUF58 domain-containing protein [Actinomycetota bacterium]